jgi:hypothetical protein
MQPIATLGIDAAKNIFHLLGEDAHGKVVLKKRLVRTKVLDFVRRIGSRASSPGGEKIGPGSPGQ